MKTPAGLRLVNQMTIYDSFQKDFEERLTERIPEMSKLFDEGKQPEIAQRGMRYTSLHSNGMIVSWDGRLVQTGAINPEKCSWIIIHLDLEDTAENRSELFRVI